MSRTHTPEPHATSRTRAGVPWLFQFVRIEEEQDETADGDTEMGELSKHCCESLELLEIIESRATDTDLDKRSCTGAEKLSPKQCFNT